MECKFCKAEMDDEAKICPACGKVQEDETEQQEVVETEEEIVENAAEAAETENGEVLDTEESDEEIKQETPKKKIKPWQLALVIVGGLVLLAALAYFVLKGMGINIGPRANDIYRKDSYTVSGEKADKKEDDVVATMGDYTLTNSELQIYYWQGVDFYVSEYSYYLSMMGFDAEKPLDEQIYDEKTGMTYQQFFLESAIQEWYKYTSLLEMAKRANFQLDEEQQGYLDSLKEKLMTSAEAAGYTDLDLFFKEQLFPGSSVAAFDNYNYAGYVGTMYYYDLSLPSPDEIEAYYTANEAAMQEKGYGKDDGNYYNVRHILIPPKGGKTAEDGTVTYSDAEWEACRVEAQKILDDFLAGDATESVFAQLAYQKSQDPGSYEDGGLYTLLTTQTSFVEEFKAWYLDETRKPGDTGLIKTFHGYHIMYFSEKFPIWEYQAETAITKTRTEEVTKMLEDFQKETPMTVNYKKIVISDMAE